MKQVVIINGNAGVGKDEFVKQCSDFFPTNNYSSVDRVKDIARMCGWDGKKDEKSRKFLSDLKLILTEYNDLPFKCMKDTVDFFNSGTDDRLLFLHIREPEEIERAKKEFNAKTLLIRNSRVEHITSNMADKNVFNYEYDYVCDNEGSLDDLRSWALYFLTDLIFEDKESKDD